jgi:hypothetical protein
MNTIATARYRRRPLPRGWLILLSALAGWLILAAAWLAANRFVDSVVSAI